MVFQPGQNGYYPPQSTMGPTYPPHPGFPGLSQGQLASLAGQRATGQYGISTPYTYYSGGYPQATGQQYYAGGYPQSTGPQPSILGHQQYSGQQYYTGGYLQPTGQQADQGLYPQSTNFTSLDGQSTIAGFDWDEVDRHPLDDHYNKFDYSMHHDPSPHYPKDELINVLSQPTSYEFTGQQQFDFPLTDIELGYFFIQDIDLRNDVKTITWLDRVNDYVNMIEDWKTMLGDESWHVREFYMGYLARAQTTLIFLWLLMKNLSNDDPEIRMRVNELIKHHASKCSDSKSWWALYSFIVSSEAELRGMGYDEKVDIVKQSLADNLRLCYIYKLKKQFGEDVEPQADEDFGTKADKWASNMKHLARREGRNEAARISDINRLDNSVKEGHEPSGICINSTEIYKNLKENL